VTAALAAFLLDLAAYTLQVALVLGAGLVLARCCLPAPRVRLLAIQTLLGVALMLPLWPARVTADAGAALVWAALVPSPSAGSGSAAWPWVAASVIAAGVLARLGWLAWRVRALGACDRQARPLPDGAAAALARSLVGTSAAVRVCDAIAVPATFGLRRPVVLVPGHFAALDEAAQAAVLCHELRHVRRFDWPQMLAEELVCCALWFQPAVWWAVREIRSAREQVVDRDVVRLTGARRVYLETLVALARQASVRPAAAAVFLGESRLAARVDALLKEVTMTKKALWAGIATTVAGVMLAGSVAARAFPVGTEAAEKKSAPRKAVHKVNPAYPQDVKDKGIQGDVVLDVLIDAAGKVSDVKATKGPRELHESAKAAVREWRFEPGPQETRVTLTMRYVLDETENK
jgi:TonB family protein